MDKQKMPQAFQLAVRMMNGIPLDNDDSGRIAMAVNALIDVVEELMKPEERAKPAATSSLNGLAPCPFCGGSGLAIIEDIGHTLYWAKCGNCLAHGPTCYTYEDAFARWNKRA